MPVTWPLHAVPSRRGGEALIGGFPQSLGFLLIPTPSSASARSAFQAPMASELVAAGDGAFTTWSVRPSVDTEKSSTIVPSIATACARTPHPPGRMSASANAGTYRCSAFTKPLRT